MEECKREMTREELVSEINRLKAKNEKLEACADKYYQEKNELKCKTQEMEKHIECLKSDLEEAQTSHIEYGYPITAAQELIDKSVSGKNLFGQETESYYYSKSELKQIAEHLLVYVNNVENRD